MGNTARSQTDTSATDMKISRLPPGFAELRTHAHIWWIKAEWEKFFPLTVSSFSTLTATAETFTAIGGRGSLQRLSLPDGGAAIVRRYYRGGFVRHFTYDLYWEHPFRPLVELCCTETARQRQVPTVEVLAAGIERVALGFYRGIMISREAERFMNLWEWLRSSSSSEKRQTALATVARAVKQLHTSGIYHADLNLTNLLVHINNFSSQALIIDFDRARVFPGSLPARLRQKNLQRLQRSLKKLDPHAHYISPADFEHFRHAYYTARPSNASSNQINCRP